MLDEVRALQLEANQNMLSCIKSLHVLLNRLEERVAELEKANVR